MFLERWLDAKIREYLSIFSVVGLTGPRQAGKSTLLLHTLPDYTYVSMDDLRVRTMLKEDPEGFIQKYPGHTIFDEAQKTPELFEMIKLRVDKDPIQKGQYVLTGSNQFQLMHQVTESLAGRIGSLTLLPLEYRELPPDAREGAVWQGSYPEIVARQYAYRDEWYAAYLQSYLEKDVRELGHVGDLSQFKRFLNLLATLTAQVLNQSTIARNLGISVPTVRRWLSVLEASYIIFLLPAWTGTDNMGKRLIKSPKLFFYDTGLVSHLVGIETARHYDQGSMGGALYENYVIAEIIKKKTHQRSNACYSYLRTQDDVEVDLVIEEKGNRSWIEIKKNASFSTSMVKNIRSRKAEADRGYLVYEGKTETYAHGIELYNKHDFLMNDF